IIDGNQKQLFSDFRNGSSFQFQIPFYDNFGDRYTVIGSADNYSQAGATPVNVQRTVPQSVDLMLLDKNATFQFGNARWSDLPPKQDRFYAYADKALVSQVQLAAQQNEFAPELDPATFHKGATSSYKQIQFGEANVQLTFHEGDTQIIDGTECIVVEPDIDYYKDLLAHALLEVLVNGLAGTLTD